MTRETVLRAVQTYVPIVTWLPAYPADWRRHDLVAGITSWGVMIPVAMAYAELAGVPAAVGLHDRLRGDDRLRHPRDEPPTSPPSSS